MPRLDDTYVTDLRAVYARPRFNATINTTPNVAGRVTAEPSRESTYRTECRLTTRGLSRPREASPRPVYNHAAVGTGLGEGSARMLA